MIAINLLGKENKKAWLLCSLARIVAKIAAATVCIILIFSGALFVLSRQISSGADSDADQADFSGSESKREQQLKSEIEKVNQKIRYFKGLLETRENTFGYLEELAETFPAGSGVASINISCKEKCAVYIKGTSTRRSDYLKLQSLLEKNQNFSNIQFPLSNITKKEDINFAITMDINEEL